MAPILVVTVLKVPYIPVNGIADVKLKVPLFDEPLLFPNVCDVVSLKVKVMPVICLVV